MSNLSTDSQAATQAQSRTERENYSSGAVGVTIFAAVFMIMAGGLQALQGLVALFNDTFYVAGEKYLFSFDVTTWGWIHLILGATVMFAGFALSQGATWARVVAVALASLSIVANFMWLPYYPVWSLIIMTFAAFTIWAVTLHGRDITAV